MREPGLAAARDERLILLAIGLLGAAWGLAVAAGGLTSFFLCASLIACGVILFDFRVGVVLLILLMPMSGSSTLFPHEMFGLVGLNPLNLLLAGTLISCMLHALADNSLQRLLPGQLLWLYIVPILIAGAIGSRHIHEIAPTLLTVYQGLDFPDAASYLRDMVLKPLLMVVFALLVGAAVAKSARPERFLLPALGSVFVMALLVLVYVAHSGVALTELAKEDSREFLSGLGLHANDLGRLYAVACALALFTWSDAPSRALRLALLVAAAMTAAALILTFSRGAFVALVVVGALYVLRRLDRKSTRLNSSHLVISYAVFCLKKKKTSANYTEIYNVALNMIQARVKIIFALQHDAVRFSLISSSYDENPTITPHSNYTVATEPR